MKKLFFFTFAVLLSLTSCTLDESLSPVDQEVGQAITMDTPQAESAAPSDEDCRDHVIYFIDEGHPCGFYLFWVKNDMVFVPKSSELFQNIRVDGTNLVVDIDEKTIEPQFCEDRTGIEVNCISLSYQTDRPAVNRSDLVD